MSTFKKIICFVLAAATMVLCLVSCEEETELDLANITLTQEQLEDVQIKIEKTLKQLLDEAEYYRMTLEILGREK